MPTIAPCKGCKKRYPGCHSQCEDYLVYKEENEKLKQEKRQENVMQYNNTSAVLHRIKRYYERRR